jgi:hypothetical protein
MESAAYGPGNVPEIRNVSSCDLTLLLVRKRKAVDITSIFLVEETEESEKWENANPIKNQTAIAYPLHVPAMTFGTKSKGMAALGIFKGQDLAYRAKQDLERIARPLRKVRFDRWDGKYHLWFFGCGQAKGVHVFSSKIGATHAMIVAWVALAGSLRFLS